MDYDGAEALLVRTGAVEYSVLEGAAEDVAAAETSREESERGLACEEAARGYNIDLGDFLVAANELAELRRRIRRARGSVDFDTAEIALYWMRTECPCRLWRVSVRVPRRLSRKPCCSPTSALQSGWQTVISRPAIACMRIQSPDSLHGAAVALAQLRIIDDRRAAGIALGSPDELQAAVDAAAGTANAPLVNTLLLRSMQRALSRATRTTLRSPRRATVTFTNPIRRSPIWWCTACSNCSWPYEQLGGKDALVRTPCRSAKARVAAAHSAADLPRM